MPQYQGPQTGFYGAEQALQQGLAGSLGGLQRGLDAGRQGVNRMASRGVGNLQPYMQAGSQASDRQAALSGAMGPQAQQAAYDSFLASPGQDWLQEQGERAVTRNAAALGGLGGGRVMQELQRQGQGLAAADFDNSFNRLGTLSDRGANAAANAGQLYGQAGQQLGNMGMQGGIHASNLAQQWGQNAATNRYNTGLQQSNLANEAGQGVSGMMGETSGNLAELLKGAGYDQAALQQWMQQQLQAGNIGVGNQAVGMPGLPGTQQTAGIAGGLADAASGVGTMMAMSDRRLKTNIQKVGETAGGTNIYTWDWTVTGARIAGSSPTTGVIAQEVPEASFTGPHGYLMVDYSRVV